MKIILVAGARPNFIKIAPLMAAFRARPAFHPILVHTGQHYDERMSDLFFRQLEIPVPDENLGVGSGSHAVQTATLMTRFEPVLERHRPDAVLVVGDVNSTVACGLTAVKRGVALIHVEAGLRSFDRRMPEEINRIVTDAISDWLFCSEEDGVRNLLQEGRPTERIHLVGNVMIDTLLRHRVKAQATGILERMELTPGTYGLVTLHRPANVDEPSVLERLMTVLDEFACEMPMIFPIHPRTRIRLEAIDRRWKGKWRWIEPLGYLEFLALMDRARVVLTDSGGIQEETTVLGVPCLTLRENTERPVTIRLGTNRLAGTDPDRIRETFQTLIREPPRPAALPPFWDGKAAERIADLLEKNIARGGSGPSQ